MSRIKRLKVRLVDPDTRCVIPEHRMKDVYLSYREDTREVAAYLICIDIGNDGDLENFVKEVEIQVVEEI